MKSTTDLKETKKEEYVAPAIEVVEFSLEESIALSTNFGDATICSEQIF